MASQWKKWSSASVVTAMAALAGCTSDVEQVTCGEGTIKADGVCKPASLVSCGPGTALESGVCVPVCGTGTGAGAAGCVVTASACAAGTELVGTTCTVIDPMRAVTVAESAEPNDKPETAKRFELPGTGMTAAVLGGTIGAVTAGKPDFDAFVFSTQSLQKIRVEAVAVGAPSVAVVVEPAVANTVLQRFVFNLDSRGGARDIVLPTSGDWVVRVSDLSNFSELMDGAPRGGSDFSYVVKVSQMAPPSPRTIDVAAGVSGTVGGSEVFEIAGQGGSSIYEVSIKVPAGATPFEGLRAIWGVDAAGQLVLSDSDTLSSTGTIVPMSETRFVLPAGGVRLGVDYIAALGPTSAPFELALDPVAVEEITSLPFQTTSALDATGTKLFMMDVAGGSVVTAELGDDFGDDIQPAVKVYDSNFNLVATKTGFFYGPTASAFVPADKGGRYFVQVVDRTVTSTATSLDFSLSVTSTPVSTVGPVATPGTANARVVMPANEAWVTVALGAGSNTTVNFTPVGGASVTVQRYAQTRSTDTLSLESSGSSKTATETSPASFADILSIDAGNMLVKATSTTAGAEFDVAVVSDTVTFVAEVEPNESIQSAQVVALSATGDADVIGSLSSNTDKDVFQFEIPAGGNAAVSLETSSTGPAIPDTYVTLFDSAGTKLAEDDDDGVGLGSLIEMPSLAPGVYYAEVKVAPAAFSSQSGPYKLHMSVTSAP